jgi:hypothetical protein
MFEFLVVFKLILLVMPAFLALDCSINIVYHKN